MKNYSFDNIIKEKAAGHEAPVPADAWDNIKKQKKKRPAAAWWTFICLLIAAGLFGLYEWQQQARVPVIAKAVQEQDAIPGKGSVIMPDTGKRVTTAQPGEIVFKDPAGDSLAGDIQKDPAKKTAPGTLLNTADHAMPKPEGIHKNKQVPKGNAAGKMITADKAITAISTKQKPPSITRSLWVSSKNKKTSHQKEFVKTVPAINTGEENEWANIRSVNNAKDKKQAKRADRRKRNIIANAGDVSKKAGKDAGRAWQGPGKRKAFDAGTRTTVTIPATEMDEENEKVIEPALTTGKKIPVAEPAGKTNDSPGSHPQLVVNRSLLTDSAVKPKAKDIKRKRRTFYVDISSMPFIPIQNNASLQSISRTTINTASRSEFTADEIRTAVDPSFTYGIALRKKVAARWYAGIGLQYTQVKETVRLTGRETNTKFSVIKRLDNSGLFLVDDTVATVTHGSRIINATNSYDFISIPVFVQYNVWEKKNWLLSLNGGLNFNVKRVYKNSIEGNLVPAYSTAGITNKKQQQANMDIFMSLRLARTIGKNYRLYAEPTMQLNLQQYRMPGMINYKNMHKAGLTIGIAWQISY